MIVLKISRFSIFALAVALASVGTAAAAAGNISGGLFLYDPVLLAGARARLASGDTTLGPALARLRAEATALLAQRPTSVMDKSLTAASGDKHDYFSFGPYWWPDPSKPKGLPYIRRDGDINPASKVGTDDEPFGTLCQNIETLGLAYWFTRDERFAQKAALFARVWFLDPATRMNPNFQHAQAIPGITDGRGIGIIESRELPNINEALALLAGSPSWTEVDRTSYAKWLGLFYEWLTTSANGRDEQAAANNHGTWYDVQVAHLALVLGRTADAKKTLSEGLTRRLAHGVQPDGSQPEELARTKSLNYSLFNLEALFACAQLGSHVGVDWWSFRTPDGRSLHAALAYLAPYVDPGKPWPKKDLHEGNRTRLLPLMDAYLRHRDDPALRALVREFGSQSRADERWRLLSNSPLQNR